MENKFPSAGLSSSGSPVSRRHHRVAYAIGWASPPRVSNELGTLIGPRPLSTVLCAVAMLPTQIPEQRLDLAIR